MARVIAFVLLAIFVVGALGSSSSSSSSEERRHRHPRHHHHHHHQKPAPHHHCSRNEEWITGATTTDATCTGAGTAINPATDRCKCKSPFVRGPNNKCINTNQCPSPCTGQNEVYLLNYNRNDYACGGTGGDIFSPAANVCRCKPGYWRDSTNKCVCRCNCPITCGPNEQLVPAGTFNSEPTCSNIATVSITYQLPQCRCVAGYIRNQLGNCVLPSACTNSVCTGANTELTFNAPTTHQLCVASSHDIYPGIPVLGCRCANGFIATAPTFNPPTTLTCIAIPNVCV